jgi:hypothetical protein
MAMPYNAGSVIRDHTKGGWVLMVQAKEECDLVVRTAKMAVLLKNRQRKGTPRAMLLDGGYCVIVSSRKTMKPNPRLFPEPLHRVGRVVLTEK